MNENILKLIFNSFSLLVNRQLFNKIKSKIINNKIVLQILNYKKIFKSLGKSHHLISEQDDEYNFLTILPDGNLAIGQDGILKIFSLNNYKFIKSFDNESYLNSLYVLKDKRIVACFDHKIEIWEEFIDNEINVNKIIEFDSFEYYNEPMLLSNGKLLCFALEQVIPCILVFNIDNNHYDLKTIYEDESNISIAINLPGDKFVTGNKHGFNIYNIDNNYSCFNVSAGEHVYSLVYSDKDDLLLTGCYKVIKFWEITDNCKCIRTIDAHVGCVTSLLVLPNGYLASSYSDDVIKIWEIIRYECINTIDLNVSDSEIDSETDFLLRLEDNRIVSVSTKIILWNY
jgi:hypothetical protein